MTRRLRIAVADDEPDMREYFGRILPRLGHDVVAVAATGRELVERCRETRPDLIITDIKMPDLDGLAAVEELGGGVPVIVVTGYQDSAHRARARCADVCAYLLKPVTGEKLRAAIEATPEPGPGSGPAGRST